MTFDERVNAVSEFGFTTRQARFLVTVMLHGGMCVPRQFARFAGTAYGHNVNVFFDNLLTMRYAARCGCVHNRAAVYHVRHAALYRAIGEPNCRNRKPVPAARVVDRLMLLDAVISHPEIDWLATAADKVAHFTAAGVCDASRWPRQTIAGAIRHFPDHLPIGLTRAGCVVFIFLATAPIPRDLKAFVQRHIDLLEALPDWTVRLVMPPHFSGIRPLLEAAARDALPNRRGRIESEVLVHSYRHLSPVIRLVSPNLAGVEEGEREGERRRARPQPPYVDDDDHDPLGRARDWRRVIDAR